MDFGFSYSTRCELSASPPAHTLVHASTQAEQMNNTPVLRWMCVQLNLVTGGAASQHGGNSALAGFNPSHLEE